MAPNSVYRGRRGHPGRGGRQQWRLDFLEPLQPAGQRANFDTGSSLGIDTSDGNFPYPDAIAGNGGAALNVNLVKLGDNTLTLEPPTGGNNYTGTTTIAAGTLDAATPAALPGYNVSGEVSVAAGATLAVRVGGNSASGDWNCPSANTDQIATLLANAAFADGATLGIDTNDASAGPFTYAGAIADTSGGSLGLAVSGGHTLILSGANSYSGPTTVTVATLQLGVADALPSTTVVTLAGGGLDLADNDLTIAGLAGSGETTLDLAQLTIDTSANQAFDGTLYGDGNSQITVSGSGVQGFTDAGSLGNYLGNFEVTAGATLDAGSPAALGDTTTFTNVAIDDQGTLAVLGGTGDWQSSDITNLLKTTGGGAFADGASLGFDTTDGSFSYGSTIADTAAGQLGLVVLGKNVLTLSGNNTYTGPTQVVAGTLDAASVASLPGYNLPGQVSVGNGATLAVMVGGGTNGSGDWNANPPADDIATLLQNADFAAGSSLGIDTSAGNFTCTTTIAGSGGAALGVGLVKLGTNNLTLAPSVGANDYTGMTTVTAGTLYAGNAGAIPATSVVDLAGGSFNLGGNNVTIAGLCGADPTGGSGVALGDNVLTIQTSTGELYGGTISGSGGSGLIVTGSGTQTFAPAVGSVTYAGQFTVQGQATLDAASPAALGGSGNFGNVTVAGGATLAVMVGGASDWTAGDIVALLGRSYPIAGANFGSAGVLGLDTCDGNFNMSTVLTGAYGVPAALTVLDDNCLILCAANTYGGPTTVAAGATLYVGEGHALPANSALVIDGNLNLNNYDATTPSLTGDGTLDLGAGTLTVGDGSASPGTFSGEIDGSGGVTVSVAAGATFTLSGTNNYTGPTILNSGTLDLESPLTGSLTVNGGLVTGTYSPLQASAAGPAAGPANTPVTLLGSATDAIAASPTNLTFHWQVTDPNGNIVVPWQQVENLTFTPAADGTYTISLYATDSDAKSPTVTREFVAANAPIVSASLVSVGATSANLSAAGTDGSGGTSDLFYEWSVVADPSGAQDPTFSDNDSATANATMATFSAAGQYESQVTVANQGGRTASSDVTVNVNPAATSISVTAPSSWLGKGGTEQFTATELDQFGNPVNPQPSFTWSSVGGTVAAGLFTAVNSSGYAFVTAAASSPSLTPLPRSRSCRRPSPSAAPQPFSGACPTCSVSAPQDCSRTRSQAGRSIGATVRRN